MVKQMSGEREISEQINFAQPQYAAFIYGSVTVMIFPFISISERL
jgi:hypothetical protein